MIAAAALLGASAYGEPTDTAKAGDSAIVRSEPVIKEIPLDSLPPGLALNAPYVIEIDSVVTDGASITDTVDILIDPHPAGLAAFSLKIATDHYGLDIVEILPGEFISACNWKMFSPRDVTVQTAPGVGGPAEVWQIVAIANTDPNGDTTVCYKLDRKASLARVVVMMSGFGSEVSAPLFFYWESCRDNVISDPSGSTVIISNAVVDRFPVTLATEPDAFPTRYGTPDECVSPRAKSMPQRRVVFINGGIEHRMSWGDSTTVDSAGDAVGP